MGLQFEEDEFLACCGSTKFAKEMAKASPFSSLDEAVTAAREIWFNQVDVNAWLQAFSAHPQIGHSSSSSNATSAQFSCLTFSSYLFSLFVTISQIFV